MPSRTTAGIVTPYVGEVTPYAGEVLSAASLARATVGSTSARSDGDDERTLALLPPALHNALAPFQREGVAFIARRDGRARH